MARRYLVLILVLLLIKSSFALGISPPRYELGYEPGAKTALAFTAIAEEEMSAQIIVKGELAPYIIPSASALQIPASGAQGFSVELTSPPELAPGLHEGLVGVGELSKKATGGVGGIVAVYAQVWIRVPYPEKYADISIENIPNVRAGEKVSFKATLVSRGSQTISQAGGIVEVYDSDSRLVATLLLSEAKNIRFGETAELTGEWDTGTAPVGPYKAQITITYDEKSKTFEKGFRIGDIILEIVNITSPTIYAGDVAKIITVVRSKWNAPMPKVYADLRISNATKTIAELKTPYADVPGWSDIPLATYWDTKAVSPGIYDITAKVYYADKTAEASSQLSVLALPVSRAEIKYAGYIILSLLFALVLLVLAILRLRR